MRNRSIMFSLVFCLIAFHSAGAQKFTPIKNFSLQRYLGTWHEIARMPVVFENGLDRVTATYSLGGDGKVSVVNRGMKSGNRESVAKGKAKFAGDDDIGYLKVSFFGPFYADYIILDIDSAYTRAMVAGSSTKYLWILCRKPALDSAVLQTLIGKARQLGYDTEKLIMAGQ